MTFESGSTVKSNGDQNFLGPMQLAVPVLHLNRGAKIMGLTNFKPLLGRTMKAEAK